jgi:hypothetical protein
MPQNSAAVAGSVSTSSVRLWILVGWLVIPHDDREAAISVKLSSSIEKYFMSRPMIYVVIDQLYKWPADLSMRTAG